MIKDGIGARIVNSEYKLQSFWRRFIYKLFLKYVYKRTVSDFGFKREEMKGIFVDGLYVDVANVKVYCDRDIKIFEIYSSELSEENINTKIKLYAEKYKPLLQLTK